MKYNIRKLQGGGFATFTPIVQSAPAAPTGSSQAEEKKAGLLDDTMYKELVTKGGLINEVNALVEQLGALESDPFNFMDQGSRSKTYQLIGKINELRNNKEIWENSLKVAKESGGLSEVAIGPSRELYVRDKDNNIKTISLDTYKKDQSKYNPLTVSELMMARQYDPQLSFNKSVFSVADQAIGLEKISDHIRQMMGIMSDFSEKTERYYSKDQLAQYLKSFGGKEPTNEDMNAIKTLQEALNTPGDYTKIVSEFKGKRQNIDKALSYIWTSLGRNSQLKLEASAAMNGQSNPKAFIYDMLISYTEPQTTSIISPETETSIKGSQTEKGLESLTAFQMFHKDKLADPLSTFAFNDPKLNVLFRGAIGAVGPLMTKKDESIGFSTVGQILSQYDYNMIADGSKVHFGDKKVELNNLNNVVYDPTSSAAKIYMPVGEDGKPDYEAFQEFKEVYAEYEKKKDTWTTLEAEKHFRNADFNLKIDQVGGEKVIRNNAYIKPFLVMYGYTNDATGLTKNNPWVKKLSSDEKRSILPILEQVWTVGIGKNAKDVTPNARFNIEDYYKAIITIPYRDTATAVVDALVNQGPIDKKSTIADVQRNIWHSSQVPVQSGNAQQLIME